RRGWVGKRWQTRKGGERGGQPFTRTSLYRLLTNVAYVGKVKYQSEVHDGEHPAIVDAKVFERVQALLRRNGTTGGAPVLNQFGAILKGLIRCAACNCAMTPAHTTRRNRRYRYYLCSSAQKKGWKTCPSRSLPVQQIEGFVLDRIRCIGRDSDLLREVLDQVRERHAARTAGIEAEQKGVEKELKAWHAEVRKLSLELKPGESNTEVVRKLAEWHERIPVAEGRLRKLNEEVENITRQTITDEEATQALRDFDPVWGTLTPLEQARMIGLLVERVEFDGRDGRVTVAFHPTGIRALSDELAEQQRTKESA
ncbi:MAG TPA: recombinase zinc beta ribbon domain-containing protein, partial [Gemmata sp.]|nr:recombinase zinc beta ribbon domain-containing protein [Gemmata sp.]